jgi:hypothetical protein
VKAGKAGSQPELKLAAALDKAKVDDFKALVAAVQSLGGQVGGLQAMADGDEQEIENTEKGGYGAGLAGKLGIEAGVTKMGSVTRTVRRSGKKWEFEYVAVSQETQSGGVFGPVGRRRRHGRQGIEGGADLHPRRLRGAGRPSQAARTARAGGRRRLAREAEGAARRRAPT